MIRCFRAFCLATALWVGGSSAGASTDPLATLRAGHPRLLLTDAQLAANVAAAKTDPLRAQLHAYLCRLAEAQWREPAIQYRLNGPRLLDESRKAIAHVLTNALAYRLTGDTRFSDFARQTMRRS